MSAAIAACAIVTSAHRAVAADLSSFAPPGLEELETHADDVTIDTERSELVLRGHVRVGASPFHLRSESLRLKRSARGIEVQGEGKLAFCPCLGTPLTLSFDDALVAPPSDLILKKPRLEIYGVPVAWLPYFWLRAPDRPGLLPPEIAYRGRDGMFLGAGAHVPWNRSRELGLDLRAGAYLKGGAAVDADLRTPTSRTKARFDWLDRTGVALDTRGAEGVRNGATWDVNLVRGQRGLLSTLSLDEAARPLDRARVEAQTRPGPALVSMAVVGSAPRGSERLDGHAFGPIATLGVSEAIGSVGTFHVSARGGGVQSPLAGTTSFSAADIDVLVGHPIGIVGASAKAKADVMVADTGRDSARAGAVHGTARASLPLVRPYASNDPADPWRHRLDPAVSLHAVATSAAIDDGAQAARLVPMFVPFAGKDGKVLVPEVSLASALGRYAARDGFDIDLAGGYATGDVNAPIARARAAASGELVALSAEAGASFASRSREGVAVTSRLRVGALDSFHVEGRAGGREGVDPTLSRVLTPGMRDGYAPYFVGDGFSAGGGAAIPFTRHFATRGGADFDLATGALLGTRGSIDLRDGCGCVTLRLFGAHRLGREGVDLWLSLELGDKQ